MADIVTFTVNPSIDVSTSVERVAPFHKLRCTAERREPGGGGINAARVIKRFGADVTAMYPAGGALGQLLGRLLEQEGVAGLVTPIAQETREDFTILERLTGRQYRFVLPGPLLSEAEWHACLHAFTSLDQRVRFVIGSGSLPPGVPDEFYGLVAQNAKRLGRKLIVDTSGPALKAALEAGVYMIKPSLREFRALVGQSLETHADLIAACRSLVAAGRAEIVALTLGEQGALLVTHDQVLGAQALPIKPVSVVGAGDSFLGAMIWSLASGHALTTAFRYGMAAGSAALLEPGTELCRREDVERLLNNVELHVI
jgi:6-phosphofructokinase 2